MRAAFAARDMAAERRGAAALDGRHHLQLAEADMAGIGTAPGGAVLAEDVRDFQRDGRTIAGLSGRRRLALSCLAASRRLAEGLSIGLATAAIRPVATRV